MISRDLELRMTELLKVESLDSPNGIKTGTMVRATTIIKAHDFDAESARLSDEFNLSLWIGRVAISIELANGTGSEIWASYRGQDGYKQASNFSNFAIACKESQVPVDLIYKNGSSIKKIIQYVKADDMTFVKLEAGNAPLRRVYD